MNQYKERESVRKNLFKPGVSLEDARKKRSDLTNQLRKEKKDNKIAQKRQQTDKSEIAIVDENLLLQLQEISNSVMSPNKQIQFDAVHKIRQVLSVENNPPLSEVFRTGIVPTLVSLLYSDDTRMVVEAAWAVTNLASGTSAQTQIVIGCNAIPAFVSLLESPDNSVVEQSIWAIGNIGGDSPNTRDMVLNAGALPLLIRFLRTPNHTTRSLRNAMWVVSNLCRGKPPPPFEMIIPVIPVLAEYIKSIDKDILTDTCWALSYLSDGEKKIVEMVLSSGVLPRLIELLSSSFFSIITPALRTIGNFAFGTDKQTQMILDLGAVPRLVHLLASEKPNIVKEACWTISNIAAGSPAQVALLYRSNVMPTMIRLLNDSYVLRKEAAWVISNATTDPDPEQIVHLVAQGVIPALCDTLKIPDVEIKTVVMTALAHICAVGKATQMLNKMETNQYVNYIIQCGGSDTLEALQDHVNPKVASKANKLIYDYFPIDDDDNEEDIYTQQPNSNQNAFSFGMSNTTPNTLFQGF